MLSRFMIYIIKLIQNFTIKTQNLLQINCDEAI